MRLSSHVSSNFPTLCARFMFVLQFVSCFEGSKRADRPATRQRYCVFPFSSLDEDEDERAHTVHASYHLLFVVLMFIAEDEDDDEREEEENDDEEEVEIEEEEEEEEEGKESQMTSIAQVGDTSKQVSSHLPPPSTHTLHCSRCDTPAPTSRSSRVLSAQIPPCSSIFRISVFLFDTDRASRL